ncbi:MAG: fimbrillin family protein [Muribaculaceae bacterium]|nr:fimbrillin family protein [Muribaculaceae bacterium]
MDKLFSTVVSGFIGVGAMLALGACSADESVGRRIGNTVIEATAEAAGNGDTDSRAAVDPIEYTSGQIGINWLPQDMVGVYGDKGTANAPFSNLNTIETSSTSFSGSLADGEKPRYAYFPYSTMAGSDYRAVMGNLPSTQYYSAATREVKCDWKVGTPVDGSVGRFRFQNIFVFLKLEVSAAGTAIDGERLKSVKLSIDGKQLSGDFTCDLSNGLCLFSPTTSTRSADDSSAAVEWTDTPALGRETVTGYVNCAPVDGLAGKSISVEVTTDRHIATFEVPLKVDRLDANYYYTVPLTLSRFADGWTLVDNPDSPVEENAAWVPGLQSRLACANTVFAIPGRPFMHKIRVPQSQSQTAHAVVPVKDGVIRAYNLPEGLRWNADRCLVEGTAPAAPGEYVYSVEFEIGGQTYSEGIRLSVSNNLHQPTPHMGWQSWNVLETKVDEASIMGVADALADNGWADAGYNWLGIDDCWQSTDGSRDENGVPVVNMTKFPNGLAYVASYIHSRNLKAGIYSDAGTHTCANGSQGGGTLLGAYGYESQMALAFTEWGFDKLKEDWFWEKQGNPSGVDPNSSAAAHELYGRMGAGIQAAGNRILLSMCEWGTHEPWRWAAEVGGSSWRMSYDHRDGWMGQNGTTGFNKPAPNNPTVNLNGIGLKNTIDLMRNLWSYTGINRFNDADMLVVGIRGGGTSSNDLLYSPKGSMGDAEYETEFAMWCMYGSPLLLTLDVRRSDINSHDVALLKNEELIAINQDPMGQGAEWVKTEGEMDYYMKDLADGDVALAVVNLGDKDGTYVMDIAAFEALDADAAYRVRDLIARTDAGTLSASAPLTGNLNGHATFIVRLTKN